MIVFTILTLLFTVILLVLYFNKSHKNLPPGLRGLPLIGNTVFFKPKLHELLTALGKTHGNIFRLYFGPYLVVVLNDYQAIKEALVKQGDAFVGRPSPFIFYWYHQNGGTFLSNGKSWIDQRRFMLSTMRDLGFLKSSLECKIMDEVHAIIKILTSYRGKSFQIDKLIDIAICNVMCSVVFNKRYSYGDKLLVKLMHSMETVFKNFVLIHPVNFFPLIRFISPAFKEFSHAIYEIRDFLTKIIDEHVETFQSDFHRDFIDIFIQKIKQDEENNIRESSFTRDNLLKNVEDLFFGGTETTSTVLLWALIFMLIHPEVQKKVQEEIQVITGGARPVSLSDRPNLSYTEATILEIQRMATVIPLLVARITIKDTMVLNYFIPKNTLIIQNAWAIHFDPKYWPNPHEFKPERFIDESGNVTKNPESFVPFSLGKRACPGESLAKMELFLFFSNLMQRFHFTVEEGQPLPGVNDYIEGETLRPQPFKVCAIAK